MAVDYPKSRGELLHFYGIIEFIQWETHLQCQTFKYCFLERIKGDILPFKKVNYKIPAL